MKIELEKNGRYSFPMGVLDVALRGDEQRAYVACMDGIYSLDIPPQDSTDSKPKPFCIGKHPSYVSGIALLKDDGELATTTYDGTLQIRALSNELVGEIAPRFQEKIHSFWSWQSALSPDRTRIASVSGQYLPGADDYSPLPSEEPTVKIFDTSTGLQWKSFSMLPPVQCVAFDPTGRYLAAGNLMGDLAVWNIETGVAVAEWRTKSFTSWGIIKSHCYISGIFRVSFSPDGKSLYAAGMGDMRDPMAGNGKQLWQRFAWQASPVTKIQESAAEQCGEGLMETLAWHPSGEYFVMAGRLRGGNWNVGIFLTESGQLIGQAKTGMRVTTAHFSADGKQLYLAGMQGQPKLKDGIFPDFGYLERYTIIISSSGR